MSSPLVFTCSTCFHSLREKPRGRCHWRYYRTFQEDADCPFAGTTHFYFITVLILFKRHFSHDNPLDIFCSPSSSIPSPHWGFPDGTNLQVFFLQGTREEDDVVSEDLVQQDAQVSVMDIVVLAYGWWFKERVRLCVGTNSNLHTLSSNPCLGQVKIAGFHAMSLDSLDKFVFLQSNLTRG